MIEKKLIKYLKRVKHRCSYYIIRMREEIASFLFRNCQIQSNKIVFDNFLGKGYGDNPKYIAEELQKIREDFDFVWLVNSDEYTFPDYIRQVKVNSLKAFYEYSTAKIWVDNVRNAMRPKKKEGQYYVQTWHGLFGIKKVEKEAEETLDPSYIKLAKRDGAICDYILASNWQQENQYKKDFWLGQQTEVLRYGLPRNDILLQKQYHKEIRKKIRDDFSIQSENFIILYAPTFRDDFSVDGYKINFQNVLSAFSEKMKKKCVIVVKLHPNAKKNSQFIQYTDDIIDGSDYPDVQRLEIASDCLISDYSSTIVDGMLLKKPVFVCALDLNDYEKNRGLMKEFYEFPIMYAYSNAELIRNIEEFEYDKYLDGLKQYNEKFPSYDCGNAACSIANYINDIMCDLSGKKDIEQ